jgi:carboxyl-terminal processing protease
MAVVGFLLLAMVTLAFALGFGVKDLTTDDAPASVPGRTSATGNGTGGATGQVVDEVCALLKAQHVEKASFSAEECQRAAITGIINSLNDPHTAYLTPEEIQRGALDLNSTYQGIGASVTDRNGQVEIITPFRDSPAERAGIRPGDIILEVDGEPTDGWTDQQAVQRIRGPKGTDVTLTVKHTDGTTETITVTRGDIQIESVFTEPNLEVIPGESGSKLVDRDGNEVNDIGYVHISQFHERTLDELRLKLKDVEKNYKGLIVDVRSNPGGLLSATVYVVDEFLERGVILSEVDADGKRQTWSARPGGIATKIPIVVLQDRSSASGAEVLAAALRDNDRAVIVGSRSFGKGTVNQLQQLRNCPDVNQCGAVYISVGRWRTPSDQEIEGVGVKPDIEVEMTGDDYIENGDLQIFKAIEILRGN